MYGEEAILALTLCFLYCFKYENVYERDVRLVYEGQNAIHQMIG